jgi:hypothetical protein
LLRRGNYDYERGGRMKGEDEAGGRKRRNGVSAEDFKGL